jgi:hypothetical protein
MLKDVVPLFNPLSVDASLRFVKAGKEHLDKLWCDLVCVLYDPSISLEILPRTSPRSSSCGKYPSYWRSSSKSTARKSIEHKFEIAADFIVYLPMDTRTVRENHHDARGLDQAQQTPRKRKN